MKLQGQEYFLLVCSSRNYFLSFFLDWTLTIACKHFLLRNYFLPSLLAGCSQLYKSTFVGCVGTIFLLSRLYAHNCIKALRNYYLPSLWTERSQLNKVTFCWGWTYIFLLFGLAAHTYINILWQGEGGGVGAFFFLLFELNAHNCIKALLLGV